MKKILSSLLILFVLLFLTSCDIILGLINPGTEEESVYDVLDRLCDVEYEKISIDIETVTDDVTLKAEYVLSSNQVTYRVEQLNMLPTDGNFADIPSGYKSTFSGTAEVKNGQVTKFDNASVTLPSYDTLKGSFNFDERNFTNVLTSSRKFSADVVSASRFLGTSTDAENMTVVVEYNDTAFRKITITYETQNSNVTIVYKFE